MASRTQMFDLLRLIDQGANHDDVVRAAWACWPQLPEAIQQAMAIRGDSDSRRARLWAAAWDGGQEHVLDTVDQLEAQIRTLTGAITRAIASLDAGYPSEALADLREVLP